MAGSSFRFARYGYSAIFDPSDVVSANVEVYGQTRRKRAYQAVRLILFYLFNLFLYAVPLTYAGFGATGEVGDPPAFVEGVATSLGTDPLSSWQFLLALVQNCTFLFAASALTFLTFHVAVWLTRNSSGVLQSIHTVVYSTGIYLAAIFSFTWYLSTSPAIVVADQWLIWVQAEFIYAVIDATGTNLELPGGRPGPVDLTGITGSGIVALAGLFVAGLYYLYSLYLGARHNHHSSRFAGLLAVGFVVASPVLFVLGSIVTALFLDGTIVGLAIPILL
ncbi:hypothetical protein [Natrarchaeobaculum aegyptiacum]|uniref:Yip1 domain-containing protein n=1 Tax=Natrarchaeobaculum aegyptiacum TaxID=745377 RepID=A0A2Z2HZF6_9EURY|nr:hypothetical protein [Natrarchaeobaculum aegyptiacum]ARS89098.1 hypothetical protein B1756_04540 [Natrarchaeobaculum aegyptiacum]